MKNELPLKGRCIRCHYFKSSPIKKGWGVCSGNIYAYKEIFGMNFTRGAPEGPTFEMRKLDGCLQWLQGW